MKCVNRCLHEGQKFGYCTPNGKILKSPGMDVKITVASGFIIPFSPGGSETSSKIKRKWREG